MTWKHYIPAATTLALSISSGAHAQSAWTQPEGEVFLQASLTNIGPYDTLYRRSGPDLVTGREITETSLELYGEYGLSDAWTLVGNLPLRSVDAGDLVSGATLQPVTIEEGSLSALGNVLVGLRRSFSNGDTAIAGQLDLELPTGSTDAATGLATGLDAFTFRPWVSVGRGFGKTYAQAHLGLSLRTDSYSHDWRLGGEVGYQFTERLLIAGTLDLVDSFQNGSVSLDPRRLETGLFVDQQEYLSPGIKGLWQFGEHFGLSASLRGAITGNNVPKAPFLMIGLTYR